MRLCIRHLIARVIILLPVGALVVHSATSTQTSTPSATDSRQGTYDGPAELPRVYIKSAVADTPASGRVWNVSVGDNLQNVLNSAKCGDTVLLKAGATFSSTFILPAKDCDDSHWIIVRTSAPDSKLPPEGTRLTPCYAGVSSLPGRPAYPCRSAENVLAKIEYEKKGGSGPILIAPGANHYRLIGLEVTRTASPSIVYNLVGPDKGTSDHLIFDRMWIHGTPQDETVRGVMLSHMRFAAVIDSYLSDFHCVAKTGACVDSQAVAGGSGDDPMGPFKIVNDFLEAAAESIEFGGSQSTATPTDIEIRHNHFFKPMTWLRGQPGFVGGVNGNPFIVKNLFELKNAQRVLFEGNILENSWGGFSQTGFGILLGPKNQAIGPLNVCPNCQVTDITMRYNTISHVASGLALGNGLSSNGGAAKDGGRYSIHDVVVDDIQPDLYNGFGVFAQISMTPGISASPRLHDVSIDHVTAFPPRSLFIIGGPLVEPRMSGLSITNSIFTAGTQPIATTGGGVDKNCSAQPRSRSFEMVLHDCFSSYAFHHNVIVGGGSGWPKDNKTPGSLADMGFVSHKNGNGGEYRLSPGSKFKHTSSDQKDVGADLDAVDEATSGAR